MAKVPDIKVKLTADTTEFDASVREAGRQLGATMLSVSDWVNNLAAGVRDAMPPTTTTRGNSMVNIFGQNVAIGTLISWILSAVAAASGQIIDAANHYGGNVATVVGAAMTIVGLIGIVWTNLVHQSTIGAAQARAAGILTPPK